MSRSSGLRPVRRSGQVAEREPAAVRPPDASGRVGTGRCAVSRSGVVQSRRGREDARQGVVLQLYSCSRSMVDLELTRVSGDRRLYKLEDVGSLRLQGLFSRSAVAEAGERSWRFASSGCGGVGSRQLTRLASLRGCLSRAAFVAAACSVGSVASSRFVRRAAGGSATRLQPVTASLPFSMARAGVDVR